MPFCELQATLAGQGQMIALDPPFSTTATIGGVIASNSSGPMRHRFGTARDLVIGMTFVTLEGKLVKTGGMVVKNVAGLDMAKLMIGSFGTLAAIATLNFRVHSLPPETRTFLFSFSDLESAMDKRNLIVKSFLQPMSLDLISPPAATRFGARGYLLAVRAGGTRQVIERYSRELSGSEQLRDAPETAFWNTAREFSPDFLRRHPGGVVLRVSTPLSDLGPLLKLFSGASISRAGSGVSYLHVTSWQGCAAIWTAALARPWSVVVEFAPDEIRAARDLWIRRATPAQKNTFAIMEKVKHMFDPQRLLNRSRLYGHI